MGRVQGREQEESSHVLPERGDRMPVYITLWKAALKNKGGQVSWLISKDNLFKVQKQSKPIERRRSGMAESWASISLQNTNTERKSVGGGREGHATRQEHSHIT